MVWLKRSDFLLQADKGFKFFNCPFNLLLIFKVLKQFAHIALEKRRGSSCIFKKRESMHSSFEIWGKLSTATSKNTRASKWTFQKSHFLKTQMKFKNYMSELHKNFKN